MQKIILKIISPSIICALVILLTELSLDYYPILFGLIIGLVNWDLHKYKPYFGVLLSLLASFGCFFIAFYSSYLVENVVDFIFKDTDYFVGDESRGTLTFIISPFIIAPILVFSAYRYIFNFPKVKQTTWIILISIILLVLIACLAFYYGIGRPFVFWQVIMALSIQLILYQHKFKKVKQ
jgi:multisubunit Na+/H+ antiporter MnhB subunit